MTMTRESQEVIDYYSNKVYKVFFRKSNRGTTPQGKLRLYYLQETNIKVGTIFTFKGDNYLVTNQDGTESNIYYTSVALKCSTTLPVQHNNVLYNVPIVLASDKYGVSEGKTISVISGSIIIYTGLNDISKSIAIDKIFKKFGGTYKVGNFFLNDNLAYFYLTRELNQPDTNELKITAPELTCKNGTTSQIVVSCLTNGEVVADQTVTYVSADETLATVDANGVVTFIKEGTVTITGTWTEKKITNTLTYNVIAPEKPVVSLTITQKSSGDIIIGSTRVRTITATVTNGDATINTTEPITWTITLPVGFESLFTVAYPTNRTATIKCANTDDYDKLVGKVVNVIIKDTATGTAISTADYKVRMA